MTQLIRRRDLLAGVSATLILGPLGGCSRAALRRTAPDRLVLPPLRADTDRISAVTVCTRPFRAEGPRLDVERVAQKTIVHNYGHGGSGWSLSWGSSSITMSRALASGEHDIAVIGCGALGLTSAVLLQRAGARVTIYAKELPPNVRSSLATGVWSPDSRICLAKHATPDFKRTWESMARVSYRTYQSLVGLADDPIEYLDVYSVDAEDDGAWKYEAADERPPFAQLESELLADLSLGSRVYPPGTHPFGAHTLQRTTLLMFNLNAYTRLLMSDYLAAGGRMEIAEFKSPADFGALRQKTLVNATGYGARALFGDESVIPVRGQLARTPPQGDVHYGLFYQDVFFVPRRDGFVFHFVGDSDYYGYGDDTTVPDRAEAEHAVGTIAGLFSQH